MRKVLLLLTLLCLLTTTGCYDAVDLNEQIFAVNLALDKGQQAALRLTVQVPQIVPTGREAAQTESDLQKNGYVLQQVEADTLADCLQLMHMVTPRRLSLMQLRGIYLSDALAQEEKLMQSCICSLADARYVRSAALVHITRGRAEDVLRAQLPLFGARLSKAQQAQSKSLLRQGVIPSAPLKHFASALNDPSAGAAAVLTAVNPQDASEYTAVPPTANLAGALARRTVDTVDLCGSAIIARNGLLLLDGFETQLLNLLRGDLRTVRMTKDGQDAQITLLKKPVIRVEPDKDTPRILVQMPVRVQDGESERFTAALYEDILALLLKLQQNGADLIGLADRARMKALTYADWEAMNWATLYGKAVFEILP